MLFWGRLGLLIFVVFFCADKDREMGDAQAEIKALRLSERLREKAVEEVLSLSSKGFGFGSFWNLSRNEPII